MKKTHKILFCLATVLLLTAVRTEAAQSERLITIMLGGFFQDQDLLGNDKASPFRATTKDFLEEISVAKGGLDFTNGVLLIIESITDTNLPSQIVARKGSNQVDVTDFFKVRNGADVHTSKYVTNSFKSAIFYAIDQFEFETQSADPNGVKLEMQLNSKETQKALVAIIGTNRFNVVSSTIMSDGNGELRSGVHDDLVGPVKGMIKVGIPKFVP